MEKDYKLIMRTAIRAGEVMLKSGAETHRVEDTMCYILRTAGTETVEANVTMTGIMATLNNPDMEPITVIKRVQERGTNLNRVMEVNDISRKYCAGAISIEEAYSRICKIKGKQYSVAVYNLATMFVPIGFALLFGGGVKETLTTAVAGMVLAGIITIGKRIHLKSFILNVVSAFGIAVTAILFTKLLPGVDHNIVIVSGIMPLVPGVAITNAIRDTLEENYISGAARILEAFVTAAAVALGAGLGLSCMQAIGGGLW